MISFADVKALNRKGNVVPVFDRIPADLDTPVGAYIKLASGKRSSFLLESIEGRRETCPLLVYWFRPRS